MAQSGFNSFSIPKKDGKNPTNTSDATATANDLLSGKTAYVQGVKITGGNVVKRSSYGTVLVPTGTNLVPVSGLGFTPKIITISFTGFSTTGAPSTGYQYYYYAGFYHSYGVAASALAATRYTYPSGGNADISFNNASGTFTINSDGFVHSLPQNNISSGVSMYWTATE